MLIDIHTHVNFNAFKKDADEVIRRSLDSGVWMVNVGTQFETSRRAVEMAERYSDGVYAAVGLHPIHLFSHHVDEEETSFQTAGEEFNADSYRELVLRSTKVVAVGEFGLDYYRMPPGEDPERIKAVQREVARQHIILAKSLSKPLMVHCRDAYEDLLGILDSFFPSSPGEGRMPEGQERSSRLPGIIHSFTGNFATAKKFLDRGLHIGLSGIITFDRTGRSEEVVKNTPLERIVLETDAPYLTPAPHRGKRNEPAYVKFVAAKIAEWKGVDVEEVESATFAAARDLLKL